MVDSAPQEPAVRLSGVHRGFGQGYTRLEVLKGIDLEIQRGELFLVVGPSGSGKSTLLCVLSGLLDSDAGQIRLFGTSLNGMNSNQKTAFRKDYIGFVFQQYNLLPTLNASENAAVPLLNQGLPYRKAVQAARVWLERMGLGARSSAPPSQLSGGEQQRVAIARALVTEPRLLICDEPTANLDGETGLQVMQVLRERALMPERSVIVVTHDNRNFRFGDRIAHLVDGKITGIYPVTEPIRRRLEQETGVWPWASKE